MRYAQLSLPCHDCSQLPIRFHLGSLHPRPEHRAELMQGYPAGTVMLNATKGYRPPELVETYSRCSHSYTIAVHNGRIVATEGM